MTEREEWTVARIDELAREDMSEAQKRIFDEIAAPPRGRVAGPYVAWLHRPDLARHLQALGRYLRFDNDLSPRLTELAILVTARQWDCPFEWHAHEPHARRAGLDPQLIRAVAERRRPDFAGPEEEAVYEFCLELHQDRAVGRATFDKAVAALGKPMVIELAAVAGYYTMIAMTLNAFEIAPRNASETPLPD